jgi:steroid 5-alpha reductase family enzyme
MFFQVLGDSQLARFVAQAGNKGKVLSSGVWRYTRHPNYFGDCAQWWGFYLIAVAGGAWWSILGPILMTVLLLRVSGVALLEKDIGERRPAYAEYIRRTNAFIPGPRKD